MTQTKINMLFFSSLSLITGVLATPAATPTAKEAEKTVHLSPVAVQALQVNRPCLITLKNTNKQAITVTGPAAVIPQVIENVSAHRLTVINPTTTLVQVTLGGNDLHDLQLSNNAIAEGKNLRIEQPLTIY